MTQEEKGVIVSNDYSDLIIEYYGNEAILDRFQNGIVHVLNELTAIVYVPNAQITNRAVAVFGYSALPRCFGLTSIASLEASGITRLRNIPAFNLRGEGVLVGVIDTGIDYTNPIFRHADGTTRIVSIWDQTIDSAEAYPDGPFPTFYGTEYTADQINQALASENPLEVVPSTDEIGHGTIVAGIAAGSEDPQNDFYGVAPDSELVIVKLKQAKPTIRNFFVIPENAICYQENDIMWAVQYMVSVSRRLRRPIAVCVGLGSSQGPHDGRGALSSLMSLVGDFSGIAMVTSAGNEGNGRRHYFGQIDPAVGYDTVELNVGENVPGFSMELWGAAPGSYSIDILSPSGEYIPRIVESIQVNREISFIFEQTIINVDYQMVESQTGDQLILMRFRNPTPGVWRFQVNGRGDLTTSFHIWLPMEGFISNDTFFIRADPFTTITSPGNAPVPITTTAYNTINDSLYLNSSRGYTRINTIKPELAAPGVNVSAPNLTQGYANATGTSVAAAHMTGIAALVLEWGIVRANYPGIDTIEIKKFLIRGARRNVNFRYPNREWGYGIVDLYNVFNMLRLDSESV
ncbi:MAG: hypothetical protein K0S47_1637 [Herbinix sp.]|jgi:subtilisin family serine protease|nr:hypothetical protein [Herbinix sp.]